MFLRTCYCETREPLGAESKVLNVSELTTLSLDSRRLADRLVDITLSYDGNSMYRTLGNLVETNRIALLFIDSSRPFRMRVDGDGTVVTSPHDVAAHAGAEAVIRVAIDRVFPNCGRYVHAPEGQISPFAPRDGYQPPVPD